MTSTPIGGHLGADSVLGSVQLGVHIIKDGIRGSELSHNVMGRGSEARVKVPAFQHQFIAVRECVKSVPQAYHRLTKMEDNFLAAACDCQLSGTL